MASIRGGTSDLVSSIIGAIEAPAKAEEAAQRAAERSRRAQEEADKKFMENALRDDVYSQVTQNANDINNLSHTIADIRSEIKMLSIKVDALFATQQATANIQLPERQSVLSNEYREGLYNW